MGQVFHYGGPFAGASRERKAFIATPSYGDVSPAFAHSLVKACSLLTQEGHAFEVEIYSGNCHVDDSRNRIVRDFLVSDCTELVFIDSDLRFEDADLIKLILHDRDVVAGIYPYKQYEEGYPVRHLSGPIVVDADGLIEVEAVPTGFLKIKRHVLEALAQGAHRFPSKDDEGKKPMIPLIFERTFKDNTRWGGDYTFCWKWRALGGRIHIDPHFLFEHYGPTQWSGIYSAYLMRTSAEGLTAVFDRIRQGTETDQDIIELIYAWNNRDWGVTPVLLKALILMAREADGPILECGSGLSTVCMAAASRHDVYALEHDPIFASAVSDNVKKLGLTNVKVCHAPLVSYDDYDFYAVPDFLPDVSLIFCDGPPRSTRGYRTGVARVMGKLRPGGFVVFDDYDTVKMKRMIEDFGLSKKLINEDVRPFYIGQMETPCLTK